MEIILFSDRIEGEILKFISLNGIVYFLLRYSTKLTRKFLPLPGPQNNFNSSWDVLPFLVKQSIRIRGKLLGNILILAVNHACKTIFRFSNVFHCSVRVQYVFELASQELLVTST